VDWIDLNQDRDKFQGLVSKVMNQRTGYTWDISRLGQKLLASQARFCSMKLVKEELRHKFTSYLVCLHCKGQPVSAMYGNSRLAF